MSGATVTSTAPDGMREAAGAIAVWCLAAAGTDELDVGQMQVTARAIAERLHSKNEPPGSLDLMYASGLMSMIDAALWNVQQDESAVRPLAADLVAVATLARWHLMKLLSISEVAS